ncbi:MAG TPA: competence protein ComEC, partial [Beijerinckiaceae bacterium]|nr:competence protein ComEC [Beijerinckiaceae bacterium]
GMACDRQACVGRLADGRAVSVVTDAAAFAEDCERAAIIVTPLVAPHACREHAEVYDRDYFATFGATYLYARNAGFRHETARNERLDRPWSPKPVTRQPDIPQAPSFDMPRQPWDSQAPDETVQ